MSYYLLPRIQEDIYKYLQIEESFHPPEIYLSYSLSYYLNDLKSQINQYGNMWDIYKKYTNPYEYIHSKIPYKKYSVSSYKPLSRAYFKMIEMISLFKFDLDSPSNIKTFHLAEGPGSFIEAVVNYRKNIHGLRASSYPSMVDNSVVYPSPQAAPDIDSAPSLRRHHICGGDTHYGMTLLSSNSENNKDIPTWKKSERFLKENPNVIIETGADGTGNILSLPNFVQIAEKYASSMDFITADGGFDFSLDFDNQENNMSKLLFGQIAMALCIQKYGGCFVIKVFDIFMRQTVEMIALLSSMYEKVYIMKPHTSRIANSEKYIICKGFLHRSIYPIYPYLYFSFQQILQSKYYIRKIFDLRSFVSPDIYDGAGAKASNLYPKPLASKDIDSTPSLASAHTGELLDSEFSGGLPHFFLSKIEEYNSIIGQQQLENIFMTLNMIVQRINDVHRGFASPTIYDGAGAIAKAPNLYSEPLVAPDIDSREAVSRLPSLPTYEVKCRIGRMKDIEKLIKSNVGKCIHWCNKHNIHTNI